MLKSVVEGVAGGGGAAPLSWAEISYIWAIFLKEQ